MILYHGSNVEVHEPKIIESDKGKDFGFAFYLTPIKVQAERMAIRKTKIEKSGTPIVSIFEWNEDKDAIEYKLFENPDLEWLEMIIKFRTNVKFKHGFDVVEGKIADDSVGETIMFVIAGVMRKEDALEKLKFQKINSQIAFCSDKSLKQLTYIRKYEVKE